MVLATNGIEERCHVRLATSPSVLLLPSFVLPLRFLPRWELMVDPFRIVASKGARMRAVEGRRQGGKEDVGEA
jgi:hypothetical protein